LWHKVYVEYAALMTVLSFGLAGYCFHLFQESNRNNEDAVRYAGQRDNAQDQLKAIPNDISRREREHAGEIELLKGKMNRSVPTGKTWRLKSRV